MVAQTQGPGAAPPTIVVQKNLRANQTIVDKDQARAVLLNLERNLVSQETDEIVGALFNLFSLN